MKRLKDAYYRAINLDRSEWVTRLAIFGAFFMFGALSVTNELLRAEIAFVEGTAADGSYWSNKYAECKISSSPVNEYPTTNWYDFQVATHASDSMMPRGTRREAYVEAENTCQSCHLKNLSDIIPKLPNKRDEK